MVRIGSGIAPIWPWTLATQACTWSGAGSLPATIPTPPSIGGVTTATTPTSRATARSSARSAARTRGMKASSRFATGRTA